MEQREDGKNGEYICDVRNNYGEIRHNFTQHERAYGIGLKIAFHMDFVGVFWLIFLPSFLPSSYFHSSCIFFFFFFFSSCQSFAFHFSVLSLSCFMFPYRNRMEVINYKNGCELMRTLVPLLLIVVICSTKISHSKRDVIVLLRTIIYP